MNKLKATTEIEVPDDMSKYEQYGLMQEALNQVKRKVSEEKKEGKINFIAKDTSGSWKLEEVNDGNE